MTLTSFIEHELPVRITLKHMLLEQILLRKMKDLFSPIKILKNQEPGEIQFWKKCFSVLQ